MNRRVRLSIATVMLALCLRTSAAQLNAEEQIHYSRRQLHKRMREAKTPSDYRQLADYFQLEQLRFRAKAEAAAEEWFHCARNVTMPTKFPTRADSAQALWHYYSYKADKMAQLASQYEQKRQGPSSK